MLLAGPSLAQSWMPRTSGTTASLRGVKAVDGKVAWASGTGGTYLETTDGARWHPGVVKGAEQLDLRGVHGVDARTAYLLSIGPGDKSRIYKTTDGGSHWTLQFKNTDPKGFFDAIAFWDPQHGIVVGDPVGGRFTVLTTADGGGHWVRQQGPAARPNEGAFAASNSSVFAAGASEVWFGTGGPGAARIFHSQDGGQTWTVATTPIRNDSANAGIFSLAFADGRRGIAVGGDYSKPRDATHNIALTSDGGKTWREPSVHPAGYRSAVAYLADLHLWIAAGPSGSDVSNDDGKTWTVFDRGDYNAISFPSGSTGWAVGSQGRLAQFSAKSDKPRRTTPARHAP